MAVELSKALKDITSIREKEVSARQNTTRRGYSNHAIQRPGCVVLLSA